MTTIYGFHTINDRRILWDGTQRLFINIPDEARLAMGDHDVVFEMDDRSMGHKFKNQVRDLKGFYRGRNESRIWANLKRVKIKRLRSSRVPNAKGRRKSAESIRGMIKSHTRSDEKCSP
ncbi:hypothetical protein HAX54_016332 [Datura stramonium]|uniref:Uncharacterized protein n=1 Tax=Datura stramonium TaxID=4076 RepID=A0ABS8UKX4_DATST|nr:hypothetical protein [Datura stramonium]